MVVRGGRGGGAGEEGARNTMKTANKEDDLFQLTQPLDSTRLLLQGNTNLSSPGQSKGRSSLVPLSASAHNPRSHPWGVGSVRKYTEAQGGETHQLTGDGTSCVLVRAPRPQHSTAMLLRSLVAGYSGAGSRQLGHCWVGGTTLDEGQRSSCSRKAIFKSCFAVTVWDATCDLALVQALATASMNLERCQWRNPAAVCCVTLALGLASGQKGGRRLAVEVDASTSWLGSASGAGCSLLSSGSSLKSLRAVNRRRLATWTTLAGLPPYPLTAENPRLL